MLSNATGSFDTHVLACMPNPAPVASLPSIPAIAAAVMPQLHAYSQIMP